MKQYSIILNNPVKLDITHTNDGTCVQYNADLKTWLAYDSDEMIKYRDKCLKEFNDKRNKNASTPR